MMTRSLPLLLVAAFCGVGCKSITPEMPTKLPWQTEAEADYQSPDRIIAVWSDAIYQQPGKKPTRGFGGRIYFYDREGQVVPVSGKLVVYAYDDSDQSVPSDQPTRKFVFTPEQLTRYYGDSDLGASYNIWLPWDAVGGDEKSISLFPVFADESGKVVRGSFVNNRLPGRRVVTEEQRRGFFVSPRERYSSRQRPADQRAVNQSQVQPVGFESPAVDAGLANSGQQPSLKTTTIDIPRAVSRRMALARRELTPPPVKSSTAPQQGGSSATAAVPKLNRRQTPTAPQGTHGPEAFPSGANVEATQRNRQPQRSGDANQRALQAIQSQAIDRQRGDLLGVSGFHGVEPSDSVSAMSKAWARQDPRSARFGPPQFRVPAVPGARQGLSHDRYQPYPAAQPSRTPSSP
jgi:hypothetical protein